MARNARDLLHPNYIFSRQALAALEPFPDSGLGYAAKPRCCRLAPGLVDGTFQCFERCEVIVHEVDVQPSL